MQSSLSSTSARMQPYAETGQMPKSESRSKRLKRTGGRRFPPRSTGTICSIESRVGIAPWKAQYRLHYTRRTHRPLDNLVAQGNKFESKMETRKSRSQGRAENPRSCPSCPTTLSSIAGTKIRRPGSKHVEKYQPHHDRCTDTTVHETGRWSPSCRGDVRGHRNDDSFACPDRPEVSHGAHRQRGDGAKRRGHHRPPQRFIEPSIRTKDGTID